MSNPYRHLPSVNQVLDAPAVRALLDRHAHELVVESVRQDLDWLRGQIGHGEPADGSATLDAVARRVEQRLAEQLRPRLRRVINATGIVLHTNLGRAPMADEAARAASEAARGYLNLELDLGTGKRSSRQDAIREWICRLVGSESATAVNNNAAATLIALRAVALGKEVIVSRGQLVEIGGSFRIPEIMAVSGATLREVGATNITRIADYERAISPNTAALLRVHTSNYRITGHTESASLEELVELGKQHGLPVIDDIGSGALVDFRRWGFHEEPMATASLSAGAALVLFSGDKLLGGPQAGILAGRQEVIRKIERDPLMRAFRLDKMTLAALEATLRLYLDPDKALREIPILRMMEVPIATLRARAETLAGQLRGIEGLAAVQVRDDFAYVGGGSLPEERMPTVVVAVQPQAISDEELASRLRAGEPAVMARVQAGHVIFDLRTVFPEQDQAVVAAIAAAVSAE